MAALSDSVRRFLEAPRFAVLATINADGTSQQTVMWYELQGDTIMMNTAAGRLKNFNVRRDPRVSICWEEGYAYVTARGTARLVEDHETTQRDIYRLAQRYNPDFKEGDYPVFKTQQRVTLLISIDSVDAHGIE
jgi:PPOX class probable F420-dependent enzyme